MGPRSALERLVTSLEPQRGSCQRSRGDELIRRLRMEPLEDRRVLSCTLEAATSINDWQDPVIGEIAEVGDANCYSFVARPDDMFVFETSSESLSGTVMRLFDTDGVTELAFDDSNGPGNASQIQWTAAATGTYFIEVGGFGDDDAGTYTLGVVDDHGNISASATELASSEITGSIEYVGDRDFFSFHATAGQSYRVAGPASGWFALVRDTDGESALAITQDDSSLGWVAPVSGTYFVEVYGSQGRSYELNVEEFEYPDDHGNLASSATSIALPYSSGSVLEARGDVDFFSFNATAGETYLVEVSPGTLLNTVVRFYGVDGVTELASDIELGASRILWTARDDGLHYIEMRDFGDINSFPRNVGTYALDVSVVPVDDHRNIAAFASVLPQSVFLGSIDYVGDADFFSFPATEGVLYSIVVDSPSSKEVLLYDSDGTTELASVTMVHSRRGQETRRAPWTPPSSGAYFIEIRGGLNTGSYTLEIDELGIADDHSDGGRLATEILVGSRIEASIEFLGDVDFFEFAAIAGETYLVEVDSNLRHPAQVYDTDGLTALTFDSQLLAWTAPASGSYFVEVRDVDGVRTGAYTLSVSPDDHGHSPATATHLLPGVDVVAGQTQFSADVDYFSFTADAGETYVLEIATPLALGETTFARLQTSFGLFDTNGVTVLAVGGNDGTSGEARIVWTAPEAGDYFVSVRSRFRNDTFDYTLDVSVYVDDHGNSSATATVILPGQSFVEGAIEVEGDRDFFSFTAREGVPYVLTVAKGSYADPEIRLFGSDGITQLDVDVSSGESAVIRFAPSSTGTYFIEVLETGEDGAAAYTLGIDVGIDWTTALPITSLPADITASLDYPGDSDLFSFVATEGELYLFNFASSLTATVRVYDTDGVIRLANNVPPPFSMGNRFLYSWTAPSSGTFYVDVREQCCAGLYGRSGEYMLSLVEPVDSVGGDQGSATPIASIPASFGGSIDFPGDADFYSFVAMEGEVYVATIDSPFGSSTIRLFDADSTELNSSDSSLTWMAPSTGMYFIEITGPQWPAAAVGAFEINLRALIDDHGDDALSASALPPREILASIEYRGDVDYFSFDAIAGQLYRVASMEHGATLYSSDGAELLASGRAFHWTAPSTGTYFVAVESSLGSYALDVDEVTYSDDHGNLASSATNVSLPISLAGTLEVKGDLDYVTFTATAEQVYVLEIDARANSPFGYAIARLYDSDGITELASSNSSGSLTWTAPSTGTYFLEVGGVESNYTLAVALPVFGDVNLDGSVDKVDLGLLLDNFGESGLWGGGDFNSDDVVDSTDLGLLLNNFGEGRVAATVRRTEWQVAESTEEDSDEAGLVDLVFGENALGVDVMALKQRRSISSVRRSRFQF